MVHNNCQLTFERIVEIIIKKYSRNVLNTTNIFSHVIEAKKIRKCCVKKTNPLKKMATTKEISQDKIGKIRLIKSTAKRENFRELQKYYCIDMHKKVHKITK